MGKTITIDLNSQYSWQDGHQTIDNLIKSGATEINIKVVPKKEPLKDVIVVLTPEEQITLIHILCKIGGSPTLTMRKFAASTLAKLKVVCTHSSLDALAYATDNHNNISYNSDSLSILNRILGK